MMQNRILNRESTPIQHLCKSDKRLAKVIQIIGPLEYSIHDDPYEFVIHEIIEQMLSVKAGKAIFDRLTALCENHVTIERIEMLSDEQIRSCGMSNAKVSYIRAFNNAILNNQVIFEELAQLPDAEVIKTLTSIKGVGKWTAKMYLIFILDRQDILPFEDGAFLQSYKWLYKTEDITPAAIKKKCTKWSPYSSIAARYMYRALDIGLTKEPFHLFK